MDRKPDMYQYQSHLDTIAAIATPSGAGGVAIVRVSGRASSQVLSCIFSSKSNTPPDSWRANMMHYGWVKDAQGGTVDEALAVMMRAPKSYTAEDTAEIHIHGGPAVSRLVLDLCLQAGARLALPGEFTRRAFLNGRIDLTQAEAVLDMVSARTELLLKAANRQLKGDLAIELNSIRESLMGIYTELEALLNFPEDDTNMGQAARAQAEMRRSLKRLKTLLGTARAGIILREGVRLVICGKPNAGKSSLLNALLKHQRAIVTDVAGTTRDTLEESANIHGIPVNLVDTAGILDPRDKIEQEAVRRSFESIDASDIVLQVLDRSLPLGQVDRDLLARPVKSARVVVLNKCDLTPAFCREDIKVLVPDGELIEVSAQKREGIDALENMLANIAGRGGLPDTNAVVLTNARHVQALREAEKCLEQALAASHENAPGEVVSEGIKSAVNCLDAVTGRNIDEDVLERIFSGFCIGK